MGSQLAKDFILHAGTTLYDEFGVPTEESLRKGIDFTGDLLGDINKAYGIGGTEFGLQPMPTLGDVDVKYRNRGSLRESNLTIKCFSPKQFEIIDTLYLRLGYTLLLEWGNSTYFDNKDEYVSNNFYNSLQSYMFDEDNKDDQLKLLQSVEKLRFESGGNYDAFFGKVSNYNWTFENGVYNISLKLISLGDIVESLRLGFVTTEQSSPKPKRGRGVSDTWKVEGEEEEEEVETELDLLTDYKNSNDISLLLYTAATAPLIPNSPLLPNSGIPFVNPTPTNTSTTSSNDEDDANSYTDNLYLGVTREERVIVSDQPSAQTQGVRNVNNARIAQTTISSKTPIFNSLKNIAEKNGFSSDIPFGSMVLENKIAKTKFTINISESSKDFVKIYGASEGESFNYIRFGALLEFIEKTQCIYNPNQPTNPSLLFIDYDPTSNYMLSNESVISADPYKCIVSGGDNLFGYDTSENEENPFEFLPIFKEEIAGTMLGNIMNIYLNSSYLINLMISLQTAENEILFFSLISNICDDINNSLGNLSSIAPFIDENTNTLRIIEENTLPNNQLILQKISGRPVEHSPLDLFGYNNIETTSPTAGFVKNFGIKTEITNDLATTISIGAQAKGLNAKYDGSALSYWNRGLQDRIVSEKSPTPSPKSEDIPLTEKYKVSINSYNSLLFASALFNFNEEDVPSYKTALKGIINLKKEQVIKGSRKPITSPAFLPLNFNLTLDGISGLKIYQSFRANSNFLPYPFPESLEFLIKGVSHKISNNVWTTTIDSLSVPLSEEIEVDSRKKEAILGAKSNPISNKRLSECEVLMVDGFATPARYGGKDIKPPQAYKKVSMNSSIKNDILPIIESDEYKSKYTKGHRMMALAYVIKEGYYKKVPYENSSSSYKTKNPGNIGNTDSGVVSVQPNIKTGMNLLMDYFTRVATGKARNYPFGNVVIPQFFSEDINKRYNTYRRPDGCLPGYRGNFQGELGFFVKKYATFARVNNNGITGIWTIFSINGYNEKIDHNTLIQDLLDYNPSNQTIELK